MTGEMCTVVNAFSYRYELLCIQEDRSGNSLKKFLSLISALYVRVATL